MSGLDYRGIETRELKEKHFPDVRHEFRVYIREQAFDRATARGDAELTREIGGVLVGEVCRDAAGPYVRVDTTIDALHAEEKGTELTFTHATWDHIHGEMDKHHQGARIVGWYHTHPGFGIFLSDRDQFIQRSFFNLPYQIALVYDPKSKEHGVFAWREDQPLRCRRYWIGTREQTWDGTRVDASAMALQPTTERENVERGQRMNPAESTSDLENDRGGLILIGLLILVAGAGAGWWFGQRGTAQVVEEAQAQIARTRLEATQETVKFLNADLLGTLRQTLQGDASRQALDDALSSMQKSIDELARGGDGAKTALEPLRLAQHKLQDLRDHRVHAEMLLAQLESMSQRGALDTRDIVKMLSEQSAGLGQLYAELADDAQKGGDARRARRLLTTAIKLDPSNATLYQRRLDTLPPEANK